MPDFLPRREFDLRDWARNFCHYVSASPESFGASVEQAAVCAECFAAFDQLLILSSQPSTRTPSILVSKDTAKVAMLRELRSLAGMIKIARVADIGRMTEVGLRPRKTKYTRIGIPDHAPIIQIKAVQGTRITLHLLDASSPTHRGLPDGVSGALIYRMVGETVATRREAWDHSVSKSRARFDIKLPETLAPGAKVWFCARWFNPRGKPGPFSDPKSTRTLSDGVPLPMNRLNRVA